MDLNRISPASTDLSEYDAIILWSAIKES